MNDLINKQELARKMQVSVSTINNLIRENKIPYVKIGRAIRFNYDEVMERLKKGE